MSHSVLAAIIVPIVVLIALAAWLAAVYRAQRHPKAGSGSSLPYEVSGGAFRGGGRQVMPRRDASPGETAAAGRPDEPARRSV